MPPASSLGCTSLLVRQQHLVIFCNMTWKWWGTTSANWSTGQRSYRQQLTANEETHPHRAGYRCHRSKVCDLPFATNMDHHGLSKWQQEFHRKPPRHVQLRHGNTSVSDALSRWVGSRVRVVRVRYKLTSCSPCATRYLRCHFYSTYLTRCCHFLPTLLYTCLIHQYYMALATWVYTYEFLHASQ